MKERGEDWVTFKLRASAPAHVALGGARFSGIWKRADEPFKCTRGEWKLCFEKLPWFEEARQVESQKLNAESHPRENGGPVDSRLRGNDERRAQAAGRPFAFRLPWKKEN